MRFIGDVHGKFDAYRALTQQCEASIQVGDFGAGFGRRLPDVGSPHRFIRGNHDRPAVCEVDPQWIPDGTQEGTGFFLGGAFSIDRSNRYVGVDWWPDEELGYEAMGDAIVAYEAAKPTIMISHDCPQELGHHIFGRSSPKAGRNRTNMGLQTMWDIHRPRLWIFGHWHNDVRKTILGCEFICLAELSHIDISL